jgi:Tol biopolymer transport system component
VRASRRSAILACLCATAIALSAGAGSASAEPIVFSSNTNTGDAQVWRMNELGGALQGVAAGGGGPTGGDLSPDGQEVIFTTNTAASPPQPQYGLYVIDISGVNSRRLVSQTESPTGQKPGSGTWGPDGQTIYFNWPELGGGTDIWRINKDRTGLSRVLDAGDGEHFRVSDVSEDGSLLTYSRSVTGGGGSTLHILSLSGGGTTTFAGGPAQGGSFSPGATRIAFSAKLSGDTQYRIYTASLDWTDLRRVTSGTDDHVSPAWSPDGGTITYVRWNAGIYSISPDGTSDRQLIANPVAGRFGGPSYRQFSNSVPFIDFEAQLPRHVPHLRYESQELYFADSAATITNNYFYNGRKRDYRTNYLKRGSQILATSDPLAVGPDLTLEFLGATYGDGTAAQSTDNLDEATGTEQADAARMHGLDLYANRIYGRAVKDRDTGKWWLQYWFWYYYNSQNVLGFGEHEGDWEMVQIGLDQYGQPDLITYSQHHDNNAERCAYWGSVEKWVSPNGIAVPVVYVANGSHASYGWAGDTGGGIGSPTDEHRGGGFAIQPRLTQITGHSPRWVGFPGRWGGSTDQVILGPAFQGDKWNRPGAFHSQAGPCEAPGSSASASTARRRRSLGAVPGPQIRVRRLGTRRVLVEYRVAAPSTGPRRARTILLTTHGRRLGAAPRGGVYRVRRQRGRRVLALPRAPGPYTIRAATYDRRGRGSEISAVRLR